VVVVMTGGYHAAEQTLFEAGKWHEVRQARMSWQDTMQVRFVDTIERLTGRGVKAFMSANHQSPDITVELFVLDREHAGWRRHRAGSRSAAWWRRAAGRRSARLQCARALVWTDWSTRPTMAKAPAAVVLLSRSPCRGRLGGAGVEEPEMVGWGWLAHSHRRRWRLCAGPARRTTLRRPEQSEPRRPVRRSTGSQKSATPS
jgi:hypothetical protein